MEAVLRQDPSGYYARMTFATRDPYRHVVERVAKRREPSATKPVAIEMARRPRVEDDAVASTRSRGDARAAHRLLPHRRRPRRAGTRDGVPPANCANGCIARSCAHPNVVFAAASSWVRSCALAAHAPARRRRTRVAGGSSAVVPAGDRDRDQRDESAGRRAAAARAAAASSSCARTAYRPSCARRSSCRRCSAACARCPRARDESRCSTSRTARNTCISRCSATSPTRPANSRRTSEILAAAVEGVRALNERYAPASQDAFYLFHRPRRWNRPQGVWMGWERKRGKLSRVQSLPARRRRARVFDDRAATSSRCAGCGTSSRSTPTRCCHPTRRRCSSARWRIR